MKIKLEVEVSDTYTKGCCYDCPFAYLETYDYDGFTEYEELCVLRYNYDECPVEIVDEKNEVDKGHRVTSSK